MLRNYGLQEFVDKLASDSAVPGGGSVAALCGALSCALSSMVGRLTIGKKKYENVSQEMGLIATDLDGRSTEFMELIDKDANAFDQVMAAYKMSKDDPEKRSACIQKATKEATLIPLEVAERADNLFDSIEALIAKGNANAQTDALVAAMLARTAMLAALYNVKINLVSIKDKAFIEEIKEKVAVLEESAVKKEAELLNMSSL